MTDFFRSTRREFMKSGALVLASTGMGLPHLEDARADALDPSTLTPFVDPLPVPRVMKPAGTRPDPEQTGRQIPYYRIRMREVRQIEHGNAAELQRGVVIFDDMALLVVDDLFGAQLPEVKQRRPQQEDQQHVPPFRLDPALEQAQIDRLREVRTGRSASAVEQKLAALDAAARSGQNLMPPIIDAIRNWCTLGEIADAMRTVFGEYKPVNTV